MSRYSSDSDSDRSSNKYRRKYRRSRSPSSSSSDSSYRKKSKYSKSKKRYRSKSRDRDRERDKGKGSKSQKYFRDSSRDKDRRRYRSQRSRSSSPSYSNRTRKRRSNSRDKSTSRSSSSNSISKPNIFVERSLSNIGLKDEFSIEPMETNTTIEEINSEGFVQKQFSSSKENKLKNIVIDINADTIQVPKLNTLPAVSDSIFHSSIIMGQEIKFEKWVKKLYSLRQKALSESFHN